MKPDHLQTRLCGTHSIYPKEIDEVLFDHPKILEACAVGVPDEYQGETAPCIFSFILLAHCRKKVSLMLTICPRPLALPTDEDRRGFLGDDPDVRIGV